MKTKSILLLSFIIIAIVASSCGGHKDCQGKRHRVKTEMGGWL
jgi:hypothetical protein